MSKDVLYDVAVIGGGLAGLSFAIQCAKAGWQTVLFEKEQYPFHRVCGEYISVESWNFLESIGVPLSDLQLPMIKMLQVTAPNGKMLEHELPLGGFGISRYTLDYLLYEIAVKEGVTVLQQTKVVDVDYSNGIFNIKTLSDNYTASFVAGCFGKRSNLDVKWKRDFIHKRNDDLDNYIGVKYHININRPEDTIALHNFENGYCGISKVDGEKFCLCYLTTAKNLQLHKGDIKAMEYHILFRNPHLQKIFTEADFLFDTPLTIAQVTFQNKALLHNHIILLGDAAGMITPLCGNGMSMAIHGSKLAFEAAVLFLEGRISRSELEDLYHNNWNRHFKSRMQTGRFIQSMFGNSFTTNMLLSSLKPFPFITKYLIQKTHGQPF